MCLSLLSEGIFISGGAKVMGISDPVTYSSATYPELKDAVGWRHAQCPMFFSFLSFAIMFMARRQQHCGKKRDMWTIRKHYAMAIVPAFKRIVFKVPQSARLSRNWMADWVPEPRLLSLPLRVRCHTRRGSTVSVATTMHESETLIPNAF